MLDLHGKRIMVTGGQGFLGSHIVDELQQYTDKIDVFDHEHYDLLYPEDIKIKFVYFKPDVVIHCAGYNGGIEFNRQFPADILYKNTLMGMHLHDICRRFKVEKLVSIMTSCAYPDIGRLELLEEDFWNGLPNESIRAHGLAKRSLDAAAQAYRKQYGLNAITLCLTNLYGPRDTFDPVRTKVVGALIRKVVEAKQNGLPYIECWGTGKPLREFMYVRDAARAVIESTIHYDEARHLNIGSNQEISIRMLVNIITEIVGYEGEIRWLTEKGDGQMKKLLATYRMRHRFRGFECTDIKDGLEETIDWYINNKEEADARK